MNFFIKKLLTESQKCVKMSSSTTKKDNIMNNVIINLFNQHDVNINKVNEVVRLKEELAFIEDILTRMAVYFNIAKSEYKENAIRLILKGAPDSREREEALKFLFDFTGDFRKKLDKFVERFSSKYWDSNWSLFSFSYLNKEDKKLFDELVITNENNPYTKEKCEKLLQRYSQLLHELKVIEILNDYATLRTEHDKLLKEFNAFKQSASSQLNVFKNDVRDIGRKTEDMSTSFRNNHSFFGAGAADDYETTNAALLNKWAREEAERRYDAEEYKRTGRYHGM